MHFGIFVTVAIAPCTDAQHAPAIYKLCIASYTYYHSLLQ